MIEVSDERFQELINEAMATLPEEHIRHLQNVAILYEHEPTPEQRRQLQLRHDQTLFGLYEGVPLTERQGATWVLPDKITIFINPMLENVNSLDELKEQIRHTLWHEIAHYYGLGHDRIHELEGK
jgi:predicted Zn-dependent protease with MMP-like domain